MIALFSVIFGPGQTGAAALLGGRIPLPEFNQIWVKIHFSRYLLTVTVFGLFYEPQLQILVHHLKQILLEFPLKIEWFVDNIKFTILERSSAMQLRKLVLILVSSSVLTREPPYLSQTSRRDWAASWQTHSLTNNIRTVFPLFLNFCNQTKVLKFFAKGFGLLSSRVISARRWSWVSHSRSWVLQGISEITWFQSDFCTLRV